MTAASPVRPLARKMGVLGVLFLTLSAETPASSVFVILPGVILAAGSGALISMAAAGLVALCMALTYAELGSTFPSAGGEYAMVGSVLGPFAGFAVLGVNLFALVVSSAVFSLGVANYLAPLFPGLSPVGTALAALAIATGLGVLNIRASAMVTGVFLIVELAALVAVIALGLAAPARPLAELFGHPMGLAGGGLAPVGASGLAAGVLVGLFAYDGYGSAVYLAEEVREVRRRLVQAVLWALAITTLAEMAALAAVLIGAPDLAALLAAGDGMIADFTVRAGGAALGRAVSCGVALAILNAAIATVLMTGRQIYATARDGVWPAPAGRWLAQVHPRFGSPWAATLISGALSGGLCLLPMSLLLMLSGAGATLIYLALTLACLLHGRGGARDRAPGWKLPLWPWPPLASLVLLTVFAVASLKDAAVSFAAALACAAGSALYYAIVLRGRGSWRLRGPSVDALLGPDQGGGLAAIPAARRSPRGGSA